MVAVNRRRSNASILDKGAVVFVLFSAVCFILYFSNFDLKTILRWLAVLFVALGLGLYAVNKVNASIRRRRLERAWMAADTSGHELNKYKRLDGQQDLSDAKSTDFHENVLLPREEEKLEKKEQEVKKRSKHWKGGHRLGRLSKAPVPCDNDGSEAENVSDDGFNSDHYSISFYSNSEGSDSDNESNAEVHHGRSSTDGNEGDEEDKIEGNDVGELTVSLHDTRPGGGIDRSASQEAALRRRLDVSKDLLTQLSTSAPQNRVEDRKSCAPLGAKPLDDGGEGDKDQVDLITISLKLPNQKVVLRRFSPQQKVEELYHWLGSLGWHTDKYAIVSTFPRKQFNQQDMTLADAGVQGKRFAVIAEYL